MSGAVAMRITGVGAITSIGVGAVQTDASLRAGLSRFHSGPWQPAGEPVTMALVRDAVLTDAMAHVRQRPSAPPGDWSARLSALAGIALADALFERPPQRPLALMLGLPDKREGVTLPADAALWAAIGDASGIAIDPGRSRSFASGRASVFEALAAARELLQREPGTLVVCGGVDSYAAADRVGREDVDGRTVGAGAACDGRVLGEAAGMLVLEADPQRRGGVIVSAIGRHHDPGHRFGHAPAKGEGVSEAIEALRAEREPGRFATVWAGIIGEVHEAKQWGLAQLRHRDLLPERVRLEHPADRLGDAGAGLGAMLLVDAQLRLVAGRAEGPALVWAVSDHGPCGCAALHLDATGAAR
ncbi:MAG: hypothetical protein U0168_29860 [Nannocystaceae bacterium]|jgi:3-oxoacyl-[acyl-carrier-protein] synthase-1